MSVKEFVYLALDNLSEPELQQVADYVAFIKFRARIGAASGLDDTQLANFYSEFAEEDRQLADAGMAEFHAGLLAEDVG